MSKPKPAPLKVLHLEDSPRDAAMIQHRLEGAGVTCKIILVNTKDSFEAALIRESFDLILSDYTLPDYDGVRALRHAQETQPEVPVILISGTVGEEEAVKCLHIGATDYLLKNRLDRLVPAVQRALQEAETRRTRKRAEAALAESETRKAAILDSVLDCIVTMDANGTVIEFNSAAARTFGYSKAEAMGRPLAELIVPPRFRERHRVGLARYLATGEGTMIGQLTEVMAMRSDGSEIPVELAITAIRPGPASIFTGVLRDTTARKQAETALRDERDQAQQCLDTAEVILLKLDSEGRIILVNRYACVVLGWTADELLGRDWIETCVPPADRDDSRARCENLIDGDLSITESSILTRAGDVRLFEWRCRSLRDDEGRAVGSFRSGTDITQRNLAVEALRQAEERMRFTLESARVGTWDLDYTTGVLQWSDTLAAQYGVEPGTFDRSFEGFVGRIHPDDRVSALETFAKAMASGSDFSIMSRPIRPDGKVRWLSGTGRFLLDERGATVRGIGISQDITERRTLEEQYQQAQKMEAIGRLAAGVAHDFNNLLTVILGFCELLLSGLPPDDPRHTDISEIQKAGMRAAGLTRQLLAFSRKEIIDPTVLDLNVILTDIQILIGRLIGEDVKVLLGLARTHAPVLADRGQVEQLILNLAVNARDAMPKGGTLTIETAKIDLDRSRAAAHPTLAAGPYVTLTVTDTGTGMTPEVQARLFEPFFTTKGIGKGTGLGLATVHGIVTRSGGTVTVESALGRGTSFKVYFPRADAGALVVDLPPAAASRRVGGQTVLVVEDADGLRDLTKRLLEPQGYTVLLAANAEEACRLFDENPSIDLLLTDVVMPDASGPELVKQLMERRPALKVIYMSGYTDEAIVHHGVLDPGIAFLHKPFSSETLAKKIREVLDR